MPQQPCLNPDENVYLCPISHVLVISTTQQSSPLAYLPNLGVW